MPDAPVRPRLPDDPLEGVVAVRARARQVVVEAARGEEEAALVLDDDGVALLHEVVDPLRPHRTLAHVLVVRRADQDRREPAGSALGEVQVGREPHAVPHRHVDLGLDIDVREDRLGQRRLPVAALGQSHGPRSLRPARDLGVRPLLLHHDGSRVEHPHGRWRRRAEQVRHEVVEPAAHPVARDLVAGRRQDDQVDILVLVDQGLDQLEQACRMDAEVLQAVDQQQVPRQAGRVRPHRQLLVAVGIVGTVVALACPVEEQARIVAPRGGDGDREDVAAAQDAEGGEVAAAREPRDADVSTIDRIPLGEPLDRGDVVVDVRGVASGPVGREPEVALPVRGATPVDHEAERPKRGVAGRLDVRTGGRVVDERALRGERLLDATVDEVDQRIASRGVVVGGRKQEAVDVREAVGGDRLDALRPVPVGRQAGVLRLLDHAAPPPLTAVVARIAAAGRCPRRSRRRSPRRGRSR